MSHDETKGSPMGAFFTENLGPLDLACTLGPHQRLLHIGHLNTLDLYLAPNVCTTYKQEYYIFVSDRSFGPRNEIFSKFSGC